MHIKGLLEGGLNIWVSLPLPSDRDTDEVFFKGCLHFLTVGNVEIGSSIKANLNAFRIFSRILRMLTSMTIMFKSF